MIVCADDFGISPAVSEAILLLAQDRRISAVSAMVVYPESSEALRSLLPLRDRVEVGLHLVLGSAIPVPPGRLFFHRLRAEEERRLEDAIVRQVELFQSITGGVPDFVDGHQHLHHYPGIRDVFLRTFLRLFSAAKQ